MLTSRNVILVIILVTVFSIMFAVASMVLTDPYEKTNRDFHGVRGEGYRAVYDLLAAFEIPVERSAVPFNEEMSLDQTYVIWAPARPIMNIEPAYLRKVRTWVEKGGHVVFAFSKNDSRELEDLFVNSASLDTPAVYPLRELGLKEVSLEVINEPDQKKNLKLDPRGYEDLDEFRNVFRRKPVEFRVSSVKAEGTWSNTLKGVSKVQVPVDELYTLDMEEDQAEGLIKVHHGEDEEHIIAATFPVEKGNITVISEPFLAQNRVIAKDDNSVLLVNLIASSGNKIVFDGFYHGLMIRGNAFWLYSLPGYGTVTFTLVLVLVLWIWRESQFLGPPLVVVKTNRRTITEYIVSMGVLFNRSKKVNAFFLETIRDGVLRKMQSELNVRPGKDSLQRILLVLSRRDKVRGERLKNSIEEIEMLLLRQKPNKYDTITAIRKVVSCL